MQVKITDFDGKETGKIELREDVFGLPVRKDILHRVVEWQRAKKQSGNHSTLERGSVRGTTAKPFRQKGTGNARQGSKKAPHMRSGAVAHGPRVRGHEYDLPKKVRVLGLKTALSYKASENKLSVVESAEIANSKTKDLSAKFNARGFDSVLLIDGDQVAESFKNASSNIPNVDVLPQIGANVLDILSHEHLILTKDAIKALEARF